VALVWTKEGVVARDVAGGRSRVLWRGAAERVVLDAELDLVWIQASATLDAVDLRAAGDGGVAVARGLPSGVPHEITVTRTVDGGTHVSVPSTSCDAGHVISLEWRAEPRLQTLDEQTARWVEPSGAALVGAAWLRAQLARGPGATPVTARGFPLGPVSGAPLLPSSGCAWDGCGRHVPFGGNGVELVVTSAERGDCLHLGCRLYDPAKKTFATPPAATAWGPLAATPEGTCGVYHFDRSAKRFLIGTSLCAVGGACEDLGGEAVGWLAGGVDVGG
jgi:hypothetical protein